MYNWTNKLNLNLKWNHNLKYTRFFTNIIKNEKYELLNSIKFTIFIIIVLNDYFNLRRKTYSNTGINYKIISIRIKQIFKLYFWINI